MSVGSVQRVETPMTTKDRVLCAFGFHGHSGTVEKLYFVKKDNPEDKSLYAYLQRCDLCGRLFKVYA